VVTTDIAALATWVVTAAFGISLFVTWLARGGLTQHPSARWLSVRLPPPYFPAPLVFSHVLLATGGLVVWIAHLLLGSTDLAWVALFMLLPVALLGFSMFGRWLGSRRLRVARLPAPRSPAAVSNPRRPRRPASGTLPESRLPVILVACHGVFGATTIVLALAAAVGLHAG
jgi:hypothetical protein